MADNIAVTAGSGTTIATDDVGGVQYQRVKPCWGVDGSAVDASATNPLPTTLTNIEKAEDAAHTTADKGIMALGVRNATCTDLSAGATDGDYEPFQVNSAGAMYVQKVPGIANGLLFVKKISLVNVALAIKASAGQLYGMTLFNAAASARFVKIFNVASGGVTPGTTVPDMTIGIGAGQSLNINFDHGIAMSTAISAIATNLVADADNTAPTANDVTATFFYK